MFLVNYSCFLKCIEKNLVNYSCFGSDPKSKMFLQGMKKNHAFQFSVGDTYTGTLQLVLSKTNRIGNTKYTIWCIVVSKSVKSLL